ncbi:zinc dependent phospholipase C family protein [Thalassospiraceae bacterium LMO-JJ14]|nr:zinc dependent phospholipase C family protein [Thalassospiraceae bacterium LMO-JJ14]
MPGAFAHLTLVDQITSGEYLNTADMPSEAKIAAADFAGFVDLGAVSPDYPYLALLDGDQKYWADNMHYNRTGEMIHTLMNSVGALDGAARTTALAWCMGFVAHVVTDMTIHPVVELKVGPYEGNESAHRICEMHQDVFIFQRMNIGSLGLAEHLDNGIKRCSSPENDNLLNPIIRNVWSSALTDIYPQTADEFGAPRIDLWHEWFVRAVDKVATEGGVLGLIPLARHVAQDAGIVYPPADEIDTDEYIAALATPEGPMDYSDIFDKAIHNVLEAWRIVGNHVIHGDVAGSEIFTEWNLDTGRDGNGELVYWQA